METKNKRKEIARRTKKKDGDLFLKKHVGLIHCENKLTLMQRKICNILLFNALDKINIQDTHEIVLRRLCSLVGYNSNDIKLIKSSIKSLIAVVMEWNLLDDNKFLNEDDYPEEAIAWNASSLLAGATIKNGIIHYSYSPQMKTVLSSLDIYGRINLFVQSKFNSAYSLVLYENCIRFKNIKQTSWFRLELFRALMGVSPDKYRSFKEFKRNVIAVAIKEINQKSDILIEPQYRKSGRNITAIQFLVSDNSNYQPSFKRVTRFGDEDTDNHQQQANLTEILKDYFNLSDKQIEEALSRYSYTYILEKIKLVRSKNNIDNPSAYLISALKKDYKSSVKAKKPSTVMENTYQQRVAENAFEVASLKNKYMSYRLNNYITFIQQQAESVQVIIKEQFEHYLKPKLEIFRLYKKKGLSSPFVMVDFMLFIDENFPHVLGEYLSFDDYITSEETL